MYNYFIVRVTNRVDGTFGNNVKAYETEGDALKEFFRASGQAVDSTHLTDSVTMQYEFSEEAGLSARRRYTDQSDRFSPESRAFGQ